MRRYWLMAFAVASGCHLVFGLDDPTHADGDGGSSSTAMGAAGGGAGGVTAGSGGDGGSGGDITPCTTPPCAVWNSAHPATFTDLAVSPVEAVLVGGTFPSDLMWGGQVVSHTSAYPSGFLGMLAPDGVEGWARALNGPSLFNIGSMAFLNGTWWFGGSFNGDMTGPVGPADCDVSTGNLGAYVMGLDVVTADCVGAFSDTPPQSPVVVMSDADDANVQLVGSELLQLAMPNCPAAQGDNGDIFIATFLASDPVNCTTLSFVAGAGGQTLHDAAVILGTGTVVGGHTNAAFTPEDGNSIPANAGFVLLVSKSLNTIWDATLEDARDLRVATSPDGGRVAVGASFVGSLTHTDDLGGVSMLTGIDDDAVVTVYDPDGDLLQMHHVGGTGLQAVNDIVVSDDGDVTVAGSFLTELVIDGGAAIPSQGSTDVFVARFDELAALSWVKTFGSAQADDATAVALLASSGDVVVAGNYAGVIDFGLGPLESMDAGSFLVRLTSPTR